MTDDDYDILVKLNDKLMESEMRIHTLETKLNSMGFRAHILNMELYESRLEQIVLLKIIDEQVNK